MERLSNDFHELRAKAREEVSSIHVENDEKIIAFFSEYPCIKGFPFAIVLIKNDSGEIRSKFRQWDTRYDFNRWKNDIFNLDRLRIITDEHLFSSSKTEEIHKIITEIKNQKLPKSLQKPEVIVLDGSEWRLKIETSGINVDYKWEAAINAIEIFAPLIELLIRLCRKNCKRPI